MPTLSSRKSAAKSGPRDVFLHLLAIIFLYMCVISFGALFFTLIGMAFPDPLEHWREPRAALRWPLAMLVIVFPLYVWLMCALQKEIAKDPKKRELKTRKWLMAFTLFLTALVIVIDLITLVYRFLGGGLSMPFVLKVLAVLVLAASVFVYYGWLFKQKELPSTNPAMRLFVRSTVVLGIVSILAGFALAGSPLAERERQFDQQRVRDLSSIQWEIVHYWQDKRILPNTLEDLVDPLRGFVPPNDPQTGMAYEYTKSGARSFELCAVFTTASVEQRMPRAQKAISPIGGEFGESWAHDTGRTCFERTIDPDRYPPRG